MERKNMVLLTVIASATLLVAVVGATFAYFSITVTTTGSDAATSGTSVTAGQVAGRVVVADVSADAGSFTKTNVYPGHREVADFSVAVEEAKEGVVTKYQIKYNVTNNTFSSGAIQVSLYESDAEIEGFAADYFGCTQQTDTTGNVVSFFETCAKEITALEDAGAEKVGTTQTLTGGAQTVDFGATQSITGNDEKFYYIVVDFPNQPSEAQNTEQGKTIAGDIDIEILKS